MIEVIKYGITGVVTTVVNVIIYIILLDLGISLQIANIIAWFVSVLIAFILNKFYVFKSENRNILRTALSFYISRVFTLIVEIILLQIFVKVLHVNPRYSKIITNGVVIILNYIISKFITFRKGIKEE